MTPIKTYGMAERADYFDFDIRAQQVREPLEQPHRHEYFQIQVNLEGDTRQTISGTTRPFPRGGLSFVLPYRVHLVPHPPGGSVDGVARLYAEQLSKELGQSVVVENRAGASGMIGAAYVARAAPDGYTLYLNASIHAINPLLYKKTIKFDSVKDFTPISELAQGALIFSVYPKVPANNVGELVKVLKADPQKYSFATSGFGSAGHLAAASFLHDNGLAQIPIVLYLSLIHI